MKYEHLAPEVVEVLQLPQSDRIAFCQADRWVGYTRALKILEQMENLFVYPKNQRMPNMLLVARSNNGKSSIVQHFVNRHPIVLPEEGLPNPCVVWMTMPSTPSESSFWSEVLKCMNVVHRDTATAESKRRQAMEVMAYVNVKVLAIDEFNHLNNARKEAARLLAAIKNVSTTLRISVLASGTETAVNAFNSDQQLKTRFDPEVLDRWMIDTEYLRFLASYEKLLPLAKPSTLAGEELARTIHRMAGGTIGGIVKVIKAAAEHALRNNRESIDVKVLAAVDPGVSDRWAAVSSRA